PIDDTRTIHYTVEFGAMVDGEMNSKLMKDRSAEGVQETTAGKYRWDDAVGWFAREDQDRAAQESQGLIFDRTTEHLVTTDKGVILLRRLYKEGIEAVKQGRDPLGVIRDPAQNQLIRLKPHEDLLEG
ncbi:MAG TPA: hypothetical protein VNT76_16945, partial [Candidatus Binatus sp.]|nr:hypothetical protein [Candidatus Binatus sp.]